MYHKAVGTIASLVHVCEKGFRKLVKDVEVILYQRGYYIE